jgi:putative ABC transport system permease protein
MRTPLAWNNVVYNKVRTAASLSGVTFAIVLIFMQLGFYDVCFRSSTLIYDQMDFDIALVSPQYVHLRAANAIPRRRLEQAKRVKGVEWVTPLYVGNGLFRNPDTRSQKEIVVLGVDPNAKLFKVPAVAENLSRLKKEDTAIMDAVTGKGYDPVRVGMTTELETRSVTVVGTYKYGSGFTTDASVIVSEHTLSRVFNGYPLDLVSVGMVKLAPGADRAEVVRALQGVLPPDVQVWGRPKLETSEQYFYVKLRPLGVMFSFGVLLAFAVGAVILYQILASEIMNKLKEYATLKAMGYSSLYMNKVVLQQAAIFALLGFVPATLMALVMYRVTSAATNLPMVMTWPRVILVLVLSVVMCSVSGLLVSRKVSRADPADLF